MAQFVGDGRDDHSPTAVERQQIAELAGIEDHLTRNQGELAVVSADGVTPSQSDDRPGQLAELGWSAPGDQDRCPAVAVSLRKVVGAGG